MQILRIEGHILHALEGLDPLQEPQALPAPEYGRPQLKQTFVAPRTPDEKLMAGLWAEILNVTRVGIHDNFFDLGGHSLLATKVISRVRKELGVDLPLRSLFEAPTVAGLAAMLLVNQSEQTAQQNLADIVADLESLAHEEV